MTTRSGKQYQSSTDKTMATGGEQAAATVEEMMKLLIENWRKREEEITKERQRRELEVSEERKRREKEMEQRMRELREQMDVLLMLVGEASQKDAVALAGKGLR